MKTITFSGDSGGYSSLDNPSITIDGGTPLTRQYTEANLAAGEFFISGSTIKLGTEIKTASTIVITGVKVDGTTEESKDIDITLTDVLNNGGSAIDGDVILDKTLPDTTAAGITVTAGGVCTFTTKVDLTGVVEVNFSGSGFSSLNPTTVKADGSTLTKVTDIADLATGKYFHSGSTITFGDIYTSSTAMEVNGITFNGTGYQQIIVKLTDKAKNTSNGSYGGVTLSYRTIPKTAIPTPVTIGAGSTGTKADLFVQGYTYLPATEYEFSKKDSNTTVAVQENSKTDKEPAENLSVSLKKPVSAVNDSSGGINLTSKNGTISFAPDVQKPSADSLSLLPDTASSPGAVSATDAASSNTAVYMEETDAKTAVITSFSSGNEPAVQEDTVKASPLLLAFGILLLLAMAGTASVFVYGLVKKGKKEQ